ncbi:MAG: hypothetical protein ACNA7W_15120 [Pseudomonadales bacterium]
MPTPEIISRPDAKTKGMTEFYTGVPCKHGHLSTRYVSSGGCRTCVYDRAKSKQHATSAEREAAKAARVSLRLDEKPQRRRRTKVEMEAARRAEIVRQLAACSPKLFEPADYPDPGLEDAPNEAPLGDLQWLTTEVTAREHATLPFDMPIKDMARYLGECLGGAIVTVTLEDGTVAYEERMMLAEMAGFRGG